MKIQKLSVQEIQNKIFLTVVEASYLYGCSQTHIRRLMGKGEIPFINFGGRKLIKKLELEQKFNEGGITAYGL